MGGATSRVRWAIWIKACLMDNNTNDEAEDSELASYTEELATNSQDTTVNEVGSASSVASDVDWMAWVTMRHICRAVRYT